MQDIIYFNCKCAPDGRDWMHGEVTSIANGILRVRTMNGSPQVYEFPMTNVMRIEYGRR